MGVSAQSASQLWLVHDISPLRLCTLNTWGYPLFTRLRYFLSNPIDRKLEKWVVMSTLPPEANGEQPVQPEPPIAPQQPEQAAPAAPQYTAPAAPSYEAPPAGAYQQPPAGAYQAPPAGGYQQPGGYAQPAANPAGNLQLNFWLSVFFAWVPALIFFLVNKDKGDARLRQLDAANLNFSLVRTFAMIAAQILSFILMFIPYIGFIGGLLTFVAWAGGLVLHILAAVKVEEAYRTGQPADPFMFNLQMVK